MTDNGVNRFVPIDEVDPDIQDLVKNGLWKIPWIALYNSCAGHTDSNDLDVWGTSFVIKFSLLEVSKLDDLFDILFNLKSSLIKIHPELSEKLECTADAFSGRLRSFNVEFKYDTVGQKKVFINTFATVLSEYLRNQ